MSTTAQPTDSHRRRTSRPADPGAERRRARSIRNGPCPGLSYSLSSFVEDQHHLFSETDPRSTDRALTTERIDGRFLIVCPEILKKTDDARRADLFRRKYGRRVGEYCHARFGALLRFVADRRAALVTAGLVGASDPMEVREEFVEYLLTNDVAGQQADIRESTIRRFLDAWSHRWM